MKKILSLLFILTLMLSASGCSDRKNGSDDSESYVNLFFDTSRVHTIDVIMSPEDRDAQLGDPTSKKKYKADVVIDGEDIKNAAFHTKGNSSLFFTAYAGKDKFSYGINFSKYIEGQSFHGMKRLNLQNHFTDASSMKEYLSYWLFRRMGINAPLAAYVWLRVNGEDQGLYTALEYVDDVFLGRTAGGKGTLYKPEGEGMALTDEEMNRIIAGESAGHDHAEGADLVYKDDNEESYPDIFKNAETPEDTDTRRRVVRALKALSEKEDPDQYLYTDEIIKYFAVHNYLVNYDSYTGPMLHNYYLYENDGRLSMLPWDYDNAFGSFPADGRTVSDIDSTAVVNTGIDSPLGNVAAEARPMWNWILSDEKYLNAYHDRLSELTDIIESGEFEKEAERIYNLIFPYIEKDPKGLFTADRFKKAYSVMTKLAELRAQSIRRQVNGQLSPRSELQEKKDQVDASTIFIEDMGTLKDLIGE